MTNPFFVKDCDLAIVSTGESAVSLVEFKQVLSRVPTSSLYFHFWGRHFRSTFIHPELHNDFARWMNQWLHDQILAERLGIIDPNDYADLEELRKVVLELIDERIDELEYGFSVKREHKFHFLRSVIIVFDTPTTIFHPSELKSALHSFSSSSIFYHFIDARRRTPNKTDDFSFWLSEHGIVYDELLIKIQHIDPYFLSIAEQKQKLIEIMETHFR